MRLEDRERIMFEVLHRLPQDGIVLIGGYAVNAYTPPRFSVDCDIVVIDHLEAVEDQLRTEGFVKTDEGDVPYGEYARYVREPERVSFDLMTGEVLDRATGVSFDESLIKEHSRVRTTVGRANPTRVQVRIADPELLFAMKFVTGRRQDVRDLFMLAGEGLDKQAVRSLLLETTNNEIIIQRAADITDTVTSDGYRDALQGPYGKVPDAHYERCRVNLLGVLDRITS